VFHQKNDNVILLSIIKSADGNTVEMAGDIHKILPMLEKELPAGAELTIVTDKSLFVQSSVEDTLGIGEILTVTLEFSEAVTLSGNNMGITLETGSTDQVVSISPFGLSSTASGTYTVQSGDVSTDLTAVSVSVSAGGTLADATGNPVVLTLPAGNNLGDNNDILVDGNAPEAFATGDIVTATQQISELTVIDPPPYFVYTTL